MYNLQSQQIAADVYHEHLDDAHMVLQDFHIAAHNESHNKLNIFWSQLHMAGGAKYIYADVNHGEYSSIWLSSKGRAIIEELIEDAQKSKMPKTLKTLKELRKILEEKNLIN